MASVLCFGDLLIDFVPTESGHSLANVEAFVKAPGGAAANVAVGLARLGCRSAFMGKVGDDAFGHFLSDTLRNEGVDVAALRFDASARTALAFVTLRHDGEREFMFYRHPSADMLFRPDEVDTDAIAACSIFHFDSISLASPQPRETALFAADTARTKGKLVSYDVNLRLPLWDSAEAARAGIRDGMRRAHVMKLSDDELEFLTGRRDPAAIRNELWHDDLNLAVLTVGSDGCIFLTPDTDASVPTFAVKPVDTTGAGDGFVSGLLAKLIDNPTTIDDPTRLQEACRFANAVGALTTTERGAIPSLPGPAAVAALIGRATRVAAASRP